MAFCLNCGTKLEDGAKFCLNCGTKRAEEDAAQVQQLDPQPVQPQQVYSQPAPQQQTYQQPVANLQQPAYQQMPPPQQQVVYVATPAAAKKNLWQYFAGAIEKLTVFSGRARRAEFWSFLLFQAVFTIAASLVDTLCLNFAAENYIPYAYPNLLYFTVSAVFMLPGIAVWIRRMHDCDKNGWYFLIPIYGWFVLPFTAGMIGPNRFGPDPKQAN
jgi:uncharacterized membrane protein YhaH (DUF805 family)